MQEYTLTRTGKPPLTFNGELLSESSGAEAGGKRRYRFHELRLYRTAAGAYVAEVVFTSLITSKNRRAEPGWATSFAAGSPEEAGERLAAMTEVDPDTGRCAATVPVFPGLRVPGEEELVLAEQGPRRSWEQMDCLNRMQAGILEQLRRAFQRQVSEVLRSAVFGERIE